MDGPFRYGDEAIELCARHVHLAEVDELQEGLHLLRLDVLEKDDLVLLVRFDGLRRDSIGMRRKSSKKIAQQSIEKDICINCFKSIAKEGPEGPKIFQKKAQNNAILVLLGRKKSEFILL